MQQQIPTIICNCNQHELDPDKPSYYFYNKKQYDKDCPTCFTIYRFQLPDNTVVRVLPLDKINPKFPTYISYELTPTKQEMCGKIYPFRFQYVKNVYINIDDHYHYFSNYWVEFGTQDPDTQEFTPFPDWFQFTTPTPFQNQQEWKPTTPEDTIIIHSRVTTIIEEAFKIVTTKQTYLPLILPRNGYDFTHIDISKTDRSKLSGFSFNKIRSLTWQYFDVKYQEDLDQKHNQYLSDPDIISHLRNQHGTFLKPAKLIRAIFSDLDDKTVTLIASKVAYLLRKAANPDTSIVKVTDKPSEIYIRGHQCFQSCMSGESREFFRIYDDLEHTKLAYIENPDNGVVLARALIHDCVHDNEHKYVDSLDASKQSIKIMDRIYSADEDILVTMQSWATQNGYWYKTYQSASHTEYITPEGETVDTCVHLHCHDLQSEGYERVPYFDTFYQYDHRNKELGDDVRRETTRLRETEGLDSQGFLVSITHCYNCECNLNEDSEYYTHDNVYCEDCYYEYFRRCDQCDEVEHRDYTYFIESEDVTVCEHCYNRHYSQCHECNEDFHNDNLVFDGETDQHYCEDCYNSLVEERKQQEEEEENENEE